MDRRVKQERIERCERICREKGVPFTLQRRAILETILDLDNHPTADQVLSLLKERSPTISRTTVYRSLETLARMGVITKVCHPGSTVRYDPRIGLHHHLVCRICDEVIDIFDETLDKLPIPDTSRHDFAVDDFRVQLRGVCSRCQKEEDL